MMDSIVLRTDEGPINIIPSCIQEVIPLHLPRVRLRVDTSCLQIMTKIIYDRWDSNEKKYILDSISVWDTAEEIKTLLEIFQLVHQC
jgi:hypothetical protein